MNLHKRWFARDPGHCRLLLEEIEGKFFMKSNIAFPMCQAYCDKWLVEYFAGYKYYPHEYVSYFQRQHVSRRSYRYGVNKKNHEHLDTSYLKLVDMDASHLELISEACWWGVGGSHTITQYALLQLQYYNIANGILAGWQQTFPNSREVDNSGIYYFICNVILIRGLLGVVEIFNQQYPIQFDLHMSVQSTTCSPGN